MDDSVCIIIPVKDEEIGLKFLLENYGKSTLKDEMDVSFIFIIDHRTSDASKEIATKFSANILDQNLTTGKGSAVRQAIKYWKEHIKSSYIIFMDADGSYSFEGVRDILLKLKIGADVVSGSRFLGNQKSPSGMKRLHIFGNKILSKISSIRNGRQISDLCTGLWGFKKESLIKLDLNSNGFDLEAEMMGKCRIKKLNHEEVAIDWSSRKGGTSKLKSFQDGFVILLRILRT
jgi:glycosyltransferase involved in cell wall biosynthesis